MKAIACELPATLGLPLSRFSRAELRRHVLSADEKTQIPIRSRRHSITPPTPGHALRVEMDYQRHGTCTYVAAWDVHGATLFGRVGAKISIEAFDAVVAEVIGQEPWEVRCTAATAPLGHLRLAFCGGALIERMTMMLGLAGAEREL